MIGPETVRLVSVASAVTAAFGAGGICAAVVPPGAQGLPPPPPPPRRAAHKAIGTITLRIPHPRRTPTNPANTTLWNTTTKTADGKTHRPRGTIRCELCRGLPCPREWPRQHWTLPRGHKKRASPEGSRLWG